MGLLHTFILSQLHLSGRFNAGRQAGGQATGNAGEPIRQALCIVLLLKE
jgi:hypothetical protein